MKRIAVATRRSIACHLNFYRIHLLVFTTTPLLFSAILFASHGRFTIKFIDALFVCFSATTGTGLTTIDLSALTAWQQSILLFSELIGNQVFVSWVVVFVRRWYYHGYLKHHLDSRIRAALIRRNTHLGVERASTIGQLRSAFHQTLVPNSTHQPVGREARQRSIPVKINPEMVRRMDVAPQRINPTGTPDIAVDPIVGRRTHSVSQHMPDNDDRVPHAQIHVMTFEQPLVARPPAGFGGFPGPQHIITRLTRRMFPRFYRNVQRTFTMPRTQTLIPHDSVDPSGNEGPSTQVPYFSFKAIVGRNSVFLDLTEQQMNELGGVEYRALNTLIWVVPAYYCSITGVAIAIITPYMCLPRWKANFVPPQQHRPISPIWFSVFQIAGAWSNTGMSLVDQNLVPFQRAYPMIFVLIFCVLAGNTAFPILFRFTIWLLRKALVTRTATVESLVFLLDHPRRIFINLFPARQTWLLLLIVISLTVVTMVGDLVLNLGNPVTEAIPVGVRILLAFLQSAATRSAGFQPFPLSSQYPAALVLYIITMYIAVYPIALSVRSTNVYEEQSLGIYPSQTLATNLEDDPHENRVAIWGRYIVRHARRQLSFDIWWLVFSLLLISIIERPGLTDPGKSSWLNLFSLIFEIVSAYGTVGLSLGVPNQNYSLSGALHPLSKLIICAVMLRGRHRGLPVALDRAVMLPREFRKRLDSDDHPIDSIEPPPSPRPSFVGLRNSDESDFHAVLPLHSHHSVDEKLPQDNEPASGTSTSNITMQEHSQTGV